MRGVGEHPRALLALPPPSGGLGDHLLKVCSTISRCSLAQTRPFLHAAAGTEQGDRQQRGTGRNLAGYVLFCREDAELFVC